jgi:hypothetical protein
MNDTLHSWSHVFDRITQRQWGTHVTFDTPTIYDYMKAEVIDELFENCSLEELQELLTIAKTKRVVYQNNTNEKKFQAMIDSGLK